MKIIRRFDSRTKLTKSNTTLLRLEGYIERTKKFHLPRSEIFLHSLAPKWEYYFSGRSIRSKYTVIFLPLLRCLLLWRQNLDHPLCDRWNILWKHLPFDRASISLRFKLIKYMWWFISWRLSSETLNINNRSCHRSCSVRKGALKHFVNLQENTCARASFLIKLQTHYFFHIFWLFIC